MPSNPDVSLAGIRALVTRPSAQGAALVAAIREAGGEATALPLIEILPLGVADAARIDDNQRLLARLQQFDAAIFISSNAARHALACLQASDARLPGTLRCFAIGEATAARLTAAGVAAVHGSAAMNSEELLQRPEFAAPCALSVLIFKGVGGRDYLAEELVRRGAHVSACALYHRAAPALTRAGFDEALRRERINVILLSSGDALANLLRLPGTGAAGTIAADIALVVPGQRVAEQARRAGFQRVEIADNATDAAMMRALWRLIEGSVLTP